MRILGGRSSVTDGERGGTWDNFAINLARESESVLLIFEESSINNIFGNSYRAGVLCVSVVPTEEIKTIARNGLDRNCGVVGDSRIGTRDISGQIII